MAAIAAQKGDKRIPCHDEQVPKMEHDTASHAVAEKAATPETADDDVANPSRRVHVQELSSTDQNTLVSRCSPAAAHDAIILVQDVESALKDADSPVVAAGAGDSLAARPERKSTPAREVTHEVASTTRTLPLW